MQAFNQHGYDATSIGTLAGRLGLSKSAIYHHFPSKEHLLEAAHQGGLGELELCSPRRAPRPAWSPADRLVYVLDRAVHVLVEKLPYVTLLLRLRGNTPWRPWIADESAPHRCSATAGATPASSATTSIR